jgi:hypothetical protein
MLPFTTEQFLDTFRRYNQAIWPMQLFAYGLGFLAVLLALRPGARSSRLVAGTLVAFWLWIGLDYLGVFNRGAWLFVLLFVLEAGLLGTALLLWRDHRAVGGGVVRPRAV